MLFSNNFWKSLQAIIFVIALAGFCEVGIQNTSLIPLCSVLSRKMRKSMSSRSSTVTLMFFRQWNKRRESAQNFTGTVLPKISFKMRLTVEATSNPCFTKTNFAARTLFVPILDFMLPYYKMIGFPSPPINTNMEPSCKVRSAILAKPASMETVNLIGDVSSRTKRSNRLLCFSQWRTPLFSYLISFTSGSVSCDNFKERVNTVRSADYGYVSSLYSFRNELFSCKSQ